MILENKLPWRASLQPFSSGRRSSRIVPVKPNKYMCRFRYLKTCRELTDP